MEPEPMIRKIFSITKADARWLEDEARKRKVSAAAVLRDALAKARGA